MGKLLEGGREGVLVTRVPKVSLKFRLSSFTILVHI
jgi:hypothetical protein